MEKEFTLLKRELQQRIPIQQIFSHLEILLEKITPTQFQNFFIQYIINNSSRNHFDTNLIRKLATFLFNKFDRIYQGAKYALEDEFCEFLMMESVGKEGKCDRFYELDGGRWIHLQASENLISEGTTGYALWEASVALLALLSANSSPFKSFFEGKRVLELGSGTGLGGLAVAALANPQSVLLTDVTQVHNSFTQPNCQLNQNVNLSTALNSEIVYWNDLAADDAETFASQFDTILGCDLVYDPEVSSLLFSALSALLHAKSSTITQIILVCTLRNPETFELFLAKLKNEADLRVEIDELAGFYDAESNPIILKSIESFRIITINKF